MLSSTAIDFKRMKVGAIDISTILWTVMHLVRQYGTGKGVDWLNGAGWADNLQTFILNPYPATELANFNGAVLSNSESTEMGDITFKEDILRRRDAGLALRAPIPKLTFRDGFSFEGLYGEKPPFHYAVLEIPNEDSGIENKGITGEAYILPFINGCPRVTKSTIQSDKPTSDLGLLATNRMVQPAVFTFDFNVPFINVYGKTKRGDVRELQNLERRRVGEPPVLPTNPTQEDLTNYRTKLKKWQMKVWKDSYGSRWTQKILGLKMKAGKTERLVYNNNQIHDKRLFLTASEILSILMKLPNRRGGILHLGMFAGTGIPVSINMDASFANEHEGVNVVLTLKETPMRAYDAQKTYNPYISKNANDDDQMFAGMRYLLAEQISIEKTALEAKKQAKKLK